MPNLSSIGFWCFYGRDEITTISNLGNISVLTNSVFRNCTNLSSVTLPEGLVELSDDVFNNTALTQMP